MKLISEPKSFSDTFIRLLRNHERIYFATAWASSGTRAFAALLNQRAKIILGVVGTHFYQTCPGVLRAFAESSSVRYVPSTDGVFHPKVYLFESESSWDALIGSANFTAGALQGRNHELILHVNSARAPDSALASELREKIRGYWEQEARGITLDLAESYANLHRVQARRKERLARQYAGASKRSRPLTSFTGMSWPEFVSTLQEKVGAQEIAERLGVLDICKNAFSRDVPFSELSKDERSVIAGLPSALTGNMSDPAWFGSMSGAGYFKKGVLDGHDFADRALERLPRLGTIGRESWIEARNEYIAGFRRINPSAKNCLSAFTRLCAMKRPDLFLCSTAANQKQLKHHLGLERICHTAEDYWDLVIRGIHDSGWWCSLEPDDLKEKRLWTYRAALFDALVYVGPGPIGR
jgi:HKD family nuclease